MRLMSAYVNLVPALAPRSPTGGITMAKNKNRKQAGPKNRAQESEHAQRPPAQEPESPVSHIQGGPAEGARKKQKSFGHN